MTGDTSINIANVNYNLTATDLNNFILKFTSTPARTNNRSIFFPKPAVGQGYIRLVQGVPDGFDWKFETTGGGTTCEYDFTVVFGTNAHNTGIYGMFVIVTNAGVRPMPLDQ
jgi:hypothetical protein